MSKSRTSRASRPCIKQTIGIDPHAAAAPEGLALVSTIINLAQSLKLKVVAEGVETEEQWRLLRVLNCDETQGFLFSKPLPAGTFESRFLAAKPHGESPVMIAAHT